MEGRFVGPEFTPGQKVRLKDVEHHGYARSPLFKNIDVSGALTVRSVENEFRPSTGEHDDLFANTNHQVIELEEAPGTKISADRFEAA